MRETYLKKMESAFPSEVQDCKKYMDLAKQAETEGEDDLAEGFMEMAQDEYTHAQFIYQEITSEDRFVSDAHKQMWDELEKMMGGMF